MDKQRTFSLAVGFSFSYCLTYFLSLLLPLPLLWYLPLERRWSFGWAPTSGLIMGWYGIILLSLGTALLTTCLLYGLLRWRGRPLAASGQGFLDLCLMSAVVFTLYFIARSLMVHELNAIYLYH